jgi:hypothetical protein
LQLQPGDPPFDCNAIARKRVEKLLKDGYRLTVNFTATENARLPLEEFRPDEEGHVPHCWRESPSSERTRGEQHLDDDQPLRLAVPTKLPRQLIANRKGSK